MNWLFRRYAHLALAALLVVLGGLAAIAPDYDDDDFQDTAYDQEFVVDTQTQEQRVTLVSAQFLAQDPLGSIASNGPHLTTLERLLRPSISSISALPSIPLRL